MGGFPKERAFFASGVIAPQRLRKRALRVRLPFSKPTAQVTPSFSLESLALAIHKPPKIRIEAIMAYFHQ